MVEKDPSIFASLIPWWVALLSILGGVVHYIKKVRDGAAKRFNIAELLGDIVTSAFVGFVTFHLCLASELGQNLTAALVGISGHMGSRALFLLEPVIEQWIKLVDQRVQEWLTKRRAP